MPHFKGKALTLWRPWDVAVVFYGKDVENRTWPTSYRGPLAIHSGKHWDKEGETFIRKAIGPFKAAHLLDHFTSCPASRGGFFIGICELYDCMTYLQPSHNHPQFYYASPRAQFANSPWAFGRFCWLLRNIQAIKPIPMRGRQRLWNVEFDYELLEDKP